MIMKCPKCHFEQPQDNYCANCGIEIAAFHPPKGKLFQRILTQTNLAILFVLATAGLILNIYFKPFSNKRQEIPLGGINHNQNLIQSGSLHSKNSLPASDTNSNSGEGNTSHPTESSPNVDTEGAPIHPPNPPSGNAQDITNSKDQNHSEATVAIGDPKQTSKSGIGTTPKGTLKIKVIYAEISGVDLPHLYEEAQNGGQFSSFADHHIGVLLEYTKRNFEKTFRIKSYAQEEKELELSKPQQWFVGIPNPSDNSNIGFTYNLEWTPGSSSPDTQSLSLEISRVWKELNDSSPPSIVNFPPMSFEFTKDDVFFAEGLIPHRVTADLEERLGNIDGLKILRFSPFLKQQTESIFILQIAEK